MAEYSDGADVDSDSVGGESGADGSSAVVVYDVADVDGLSGVDDSGGAEGGLVGASGAECVSCYVGVAVKANEDEVVAAVVMLYLIGECDSSVDASVV